MGSASSARGVTRCQTKPPCDNHAVLGVVTLPEGSGHRACARGLHHAAAKGGHTTPSSQQRTNRSSRRRPSTPPAEQLGRRPLLKLLDTMGWAFSDPDAINASARTARPQCVETSSRPRDADRHHPGTSLPHAGPDQQPLQSHGCRGRGRHQGPPGRRAALDGRPAPQGREEQPEKLQPPLPPPVHRSRTRRGSRRNGGLAMKTSRTMLKTIKGTALLAVIAAASSCVDADVSDAPPEALTTDCAEGTELVNQSCQPVSPSARRVSVGAQLARRLRQLLARRERPHGASENGTQRQGPVTPSGGGRKHGSSRSGPRRRARPASRHGSGRRGGYAARTEECCSAATST